jgi:hypothetical protein
MRIIHSICRHWAVNDGRTCVGVVDLVGDVFIARDAVGERVGRFATLAAAAAAFTPNLAESRDGERNG